MLNLFDSQTNERMLLFRRREGEEKENLEERAARRNPLLLLPSRTLHTILYFFFRHARCMRFSTLASVTYATYNSVLLFPVRTLKRSFLPLCQTKLSTFISVTHATINFAMHATLERLAGFVHLI